MKSNFLKSATMAIFAIATSASLSIADEKDTLDATDVKFVKQEAAVGMATVAVAELGVKKANHADVKALSATLVTDHTAVNKELQGLATQKGVDISSVLDAGATKDIQKLETYSGAEFDKEFLAHIISGHKKCISAFEESAKDAKNADLKAWSNKILPTLKAHLAKAEGLTVK